MSPNECVLCSDDQRAIDDAAKKLMATSQLGVAKVAFGERFLATVQDSLARPLTDRELASFDSAVDQIAMHYATMAANSDPTRPMVRWDEAPAHAWADGAVVPGSKYMGDNPDTVYRSIPVDGTSSYVLTGRTSPDVSARPLNTIFQITDNWDAGAPYIAELDLTEVPIDASGRFTITIGPDDTAQMQTARGAAQLFVRDTLGDWATTDVPVYTIDRVAGPSVRPAPDIEEMAELSARLLSESRYLEIYVPLNFRAAPNEIHPIFTINNFTRGFGHFHLESDEALVVTTDSAGAGYVSVSIQDTWTVTPDYVRTQTSLNTGQARPNPDGTYTFVISAVDPGVHNWVSTAGLVDGTLFLRWQGSTTLSTPTLESRVVAMSALDGALPAGTPTVSPPGREQQLRERERGFKRRFGETTAGE